MPATKPSAGTIRPSIALEIVQDARLVRYDLEHLSDKAFIERALTFFADNSVARSAISKITPQEAPTNERPTTPTANEHQSDPKPAQRGQLYDPAELDF